MSITFPFTEDSVEEFFNCDMAIARRALPRGTVDVICTGKFTNEGTWNNDYQYAVQNGAISLLSHRNKRFFTFNSLMVENNVVFIGGEDCLAVSDKQHMQAAMYFKKPLGLNFHVVISSHVDYAADTLPRIIRSLKRYGVEKDRITVVVGGAKAVEKTELADYNRIDITDNQMGCTGLVPVLRGLLEVKEDYLFLMHDTCEVLEGFTAKMSDVDVGFPCDIISAAAGVGFEIGLWSTRFLAELSEFEMPNLVNEKNPYLTANQMRQFANAHRVLGDMNAGRSKDVYGTGGMRQVFEYTAVPMKKYVGKKTAGGRA